MTRLALAIYRFFTELLAGVFDWLRKPGAFIKVFAALCCVSFGISAGVAYDQHAKLLETRGQVLACKTDVEGLERELQTWEGRILAIKSEMEAADAEYRRQVEVARGIGLRLESDLEAERERARVFQQRYEGRPQECSAALELLDTTCKTLGGY